MARGIKNTKAGAKPASTPSGVRNRVRQFIRGPGRDPMMMIYPAFVTRA